MAFSGIIYFIIIIITLIIIIKALVQGQGPDSGSIKNVVYLDKPTGIRHDCEIDFNDISNPVKHDTKTGKSYLTRKRKVFDKSDPMLFLEDYEICDYPGWTLYINHANTKSSEAANEWRVKYLNEKSICNALKVEVLEYRAKFGELSDMRIDKDIERVEKLKPVSIKKGGR